MRAYEFITERHVSDPTQSQCSPKSGKRLSNMRRSQCVSLGYLSHDSDHTAGTGTQGKKGTGVPLRGKKLKSTLHGGTVKSYPRG